MTNHSTKLYVEMKSRFQISLMKILSVDSKNFRFSYITTMLPSTDLGMQDSVFPI